MTGESAFAARLETVSHRYGKTVALDAVSLELPAGRMVAFIGPDGVGKSTLLGLIAGARKIQSGRVEALGGDMASERHRSAAHPRIAYMPQGLGKNLYMDLTVFENLEFFGQLFGQGRQEREQRIADLLKSTGLDPFRDRSAGKLSGGMKQKLGLCCALIHDPDLMILDEPTTGVDPVSRREFWKLLSEFLSQGITIVMSTPYLDEAERCTRVALVNGGRLLALDTPDALRATLPGALFEVIVAEPRHAAAAIARAPGVSAVHFFGARAHVRLTGTDQGAAAALRSHLESEGLAVTGVRPIQTSLEDVFIARVSEATS